jgi:hypothetical protein
VLRYRERRHFRDGGLEEDDWQEALSPNLIVGVPAATTMDVAVNFIGPPLSALGLSALEVDLSYADPKGNPRFVQSTTLLLTEDAATHNQDWKIRLPDREARTYHWTLTLIHADGTQTSSDDNPETRNRLVLRVPRL